MKFKFNHNFLLILSSSVIALCACQAEVSAPKQSSTQDLFAQMEALEADESALLFQQAKAAAEKDDVKEAKSLIKQALGRGAGTKGMSTAESEIKKSEARIAERKRKAEDARRAREAEEIASIAAINSANSNNSAHSRLSGLKSIQGVIVGDSYADTYNAYCLDGTYTSVTHNKGVTSTICASNTHKSSLCKSAYDWSIRDAGEYGCER